MRTQSGRAHSLAALLFAFMLVTGCQDQESNGPRDAGSATTGAPESQKGSSSQASNTSSPKNNTEKSESDTPAFRIVGHSSVGEGCRVAGQEPNATAIVTNSMPENTADYAQWTFDRLNSEVGVTGTSLPCQVSLSLKWTPGYRIVAKSVQIDVEFSGDLDDGSQDGVWDGRFFSRVGFSNRSIIEREKQFRSATEDGSFLLDHGTGESSDCSGKGEWTLTMGLEVTMDPEGEPVLSIDQASVLFELADPASVEACS